MHANKCHIYRVCTDASAIARDAQRTLENASARKANPAEVELCCPRNVAHLRRDAARQPQLPRRRTWPGRGQSRLWGPQLCSRRRKRYLPNLTKVCSLCHERNMVPQAFFCLIKWPVNGKDLRGTATAPVVLGHKKSFHQQKFHRELYCY